MRDPACLVVSCCNHVSHVRSSVSSRLTLSRVPLSWWILVPYTVTPPLLLYHDTPFSLHKIPKYLFPLLGLLWLWVWCFLCTRAKIHSTTRWLVDEVDLALRITSLRIRVRRPLGAVVVAPLRVPGIWLWSLSLQRTSLLLGPLLQDRFCPYLMEVVTVSEVYSLFHGELGASELIVHGASATPTIELSVVRGYYGHRFAYLFSHEIWNLLSRAQYIAPVQVVAFQGFLVRFPDQEDAVKPYGCFYNADEVTMRRPRCLVHGFGGNGFMCGGNRIVERC